MGNACLEITAKKGEWSATEKWKNKKLQTLFATAMVSDNYVYGCHGDLSAFSLKCLDLKTGDVKWEERVEERQSLLAVGGYLGKLVRKAYGPLSIDEAMPLDELATPRAVLDRLLPAEVILPEMERVRLNVEQEAQVRQGRAVRVVPDPGPGLVRAHDADGRLVALGHADPLRRTFVPEKVLS